MDDRLATLFLYPIKKGTGLGSDSDDIPNFSFGFRMAGIFPFTGLAAPTGGRPNRTTGESDPWRARKGKAE